MIKAVSYHPLRLQPRGALPSCGLGCRTAHLGQGMWTSDLYIFSVQTGSTRVGEKEKERGKGGRGEAIRWPDKQGVVLPAPTVPPAGTEAISTS